MKLRIGFPRVTKLGSTRGSCCVAVDDFVVLVLVASCEVCQVLVAFPCVLTVFLLPCFFMLSFRICLPIISLVIRLYLSGVPLFGVVGCF